MFAFEILLLKIKRTELYNPLTNTWNKTGDVLVGRASPALVTLKNGKVLLTGGDTFPYASSTGESELYDPLTGNWTA